MRNEIATPASQGCGGGLPAFFRAGRCQKGPYSEEHKRERHRKLGHHDRPPLRHHSDGRWLCDAYDETRISASPLRLVAKPVRRLKSCQKKFVVIPITREDRQVRPLR